jgi:hypothetical protein
LCFVRSLHFTSMPVIFPTRVAIAFSLLPVESRVARASPCQAMCQCSTVQYGSRASAARLDVDFFFLFSLFLLPFSFRCDAFNHRSLRTHTHALSPIRKTQCARIMGPGTMPPNGLVSLSTTQCPVLPASRPIRESGIEEEDIPVGHADRVSFWG